MTLHSVNVADQVETPLLPTLLRIGKLVRIYQNLRLGEIGLQNGQDELLLELSEAPKSVSYLAAVLNVRPSTVSKMVDVLVAKGLLRRIECTTDLRRTLIAPTSAGTAKGEAVRNAWDGLETELLRSQKASSAGSLKIELESLHAHIAQRLARLR